MLEQITIKRQKIKGRNRQAVFWTRAITREVPQESLPEFRSYEPYGSYDNIFINDLKERGTTIDDDMNGFEAIKLKAVCTEL